MYDEHMIVEMTDISLRMFVRTKRGIGTADSYDRGKTWVNNADYKIPGPNSRFFIGRLKSGRLLLVNHFNFTGRNNLTALLSDDDGKTWKYNLTIDKRSDVSYPDVKEAEDGYIYIVYDHERGAAYSASSKSIKRTYSRAREILYAKITESDIMNGSIVHEGSSLCNCISKLGRYACESNNPYRETDFMTDIELTDYLLENQTYGDAVEALLDLYPVNCMTQSKYDDVDILIDKMLSEPNQRNKQNFVRIVCAIRNIQRDGEPFDSPIITSVMTYLQHEFSDDIKLDELAKRFNVGRYYLCHAFKKATGISIINYRDEMRMFNAKRLLATSDKSIQDIALYCGFSTHSRFTETFNAIEGISPTEFRKKVSGK